MTWWFCRIDFCSDIFFW